MPTISFDYPQLSRRVVQTLRAEFPTDTIATTEGYGGRVQVKVVSERFNGMSEREKQDFIWSLLRDNLGEDANGVSFALAYGTDEL